MKKQFVVLAALVATPLVAFNPQLTPAYSQPSGSLVIAGQSIGKIRLGMSTAQVRKLLGKPDKSLRLSNGLTDDLFRSKRTRVDVDGQTVRDKLEVLYKAGKVMQIEATSPMVRTASGLSTASPLSVLNRALNPKRYTTYDYGDSTGGYFQYYLDQVQSGIAFESGTHQDNWFWDRGSETLIVHRKGVPVIPDQGGTFYSSTAYVPAEDQ